MSSGLFTKNKDAVELFSKCEEVQRLFHRQTVGEGIDGLFTALLEARRKVSALTSDILISYCGDYDNEERKALELALSKISSHLLSCVCSVELFGITMKLSEEGEEMLKKINESIAKAKDFKELSNYLKQVKL